MAASHPEDIHKLFARSFEAGDLEGILSLYEANAAFVMESGEIVRGHAAIREALRSFLVSRPRIELELDHVVEAEGLALVVSRWKIHGMDKDGKPVQLEGRTADVARRQPDGKWLVAIDHPYAGGGGRRGKQ